MIKAAFTDMKTGTTVVIEVPSALEFIEEMNKLKTSGYVPYGCDKCKADRNHPVIPTDFEPPDKKPWNPDDDMPQTA